jgi:hypothetical protein
MFTVKHIDIFGGETLSQVATARFAPGNDKPSTGRQGDCSGTPNTVWVRDVPTQAEYPLTGGTIFVMNDNGKTVGRYDLGTVEEPRTWREPVLAGDDYTARVA